MNNETVISGSSVTGEKTVYSHAVTVCGIPVIYIVIIALLILVILYLFCRMKRKDCHHFIKKSSYIKLFVAFFVPLFFYNLYDFYNNSWYYNIYSNTWSNLLWFDNPVLVIMTASTISLIEFIFPYLFLTFSILTIKCYLKWS
jgi:hypothetical protein